MFTTCKGCSASVSDDRETCPHCSTEIVPLNESMEQLAGEIGRLQYVLMVLNGAETFTVDAKEMTAMRKVRDELLISIKKLEEEKKSEAAVTV